MLEILSCIGVTSLNIYVGQNGSNSLEASSFYDNKKKTFLDYKLN